MKARNTLFLAVLSVLVGCSAPAARRSQAPAVPAASQELSELQIFVDVVGAEILIDKEHWADVMDTYAQVYRIAPGRHDIAISCPGYRTYETSVRIAAGNRHGLLVRLEPVAGAEAAQKRPSRDARTGPAMVGTLAIVADVPDASIYIDGKLYAVTAAPREEQVFGMVTGEHDVVVSAPGYREFFARVLVTDRNMHRIYAGILGADAVAAPAATPPAGSQ